LLIAGAPFLVTTRVPEEAHASASATSPITMTRVTIVSLYLRRCFFEACFMGYVLPDVFRKRV
jgi:hypothetical protein